MRRVNMIEILLQALQVTAIVEYGIRCTTGMQGLWHCPALQDLYPLSLTDFTTMMSHRCGKVAVDHDHLHQRHCRKHVRHLTD